MGKERREGRRKVGVGEKEPKMESQKRSEEGSERGFLRERSQKINVEEEKK